MPRQTAVPRSRTDAVEEAGRDSGADEPDSAVEEDGDSDSDEWSRKPSNRKLSFKICMAIRFGNKPGGIGHRPTVGALSKEIGEPVHAIVAAETKSRRLQGGICKDKYFLPEIAQSLEDWKVQAIARSSPHSWQIRWPPASSSKEEERRVVTFKIGPVGDLPAAKEERRVDTFKIGPVEAEMVPAKKKADKSKEGEQNEEERRQCRGGGAGQQKTGGGSGAESASTRRRIQGGAESAGGGAGAEGAGTSASTRALQQGGAGAESARGGAESARGGAESPRGGDAGGTQG